MTWAPVGPALVPFHPCGMVMDFMVRAYTCKMQLWDNGPPTEVRWFRAPEGAQVYEGETPFRSHRHYPREKQFPLGEVPGTRKYYNGRPPANLRGRRPCGTDELFRSGGILGVTPPLLCNAVGIPPCCEVIALSAGGGVVIGGSGTFNFAHEHATLDALVELEASERGGKLEWIDIEVELEAGEGATEDASLDVLADLDGSESSTESASLDIEVELEASEGATEDASLDHESELEGSESSTGPEWLGGLGDFPLGNEPL